MTIDQVLREAQYLLHDPENLAANDDERRANAEAVLDTYHRAQRHRRGTSQALQGLLLNLTDVLGSGEDCKLDHIESLEVAAELDRRGAVSEIAVLRDNESQRLRDAYDDRRRAQHEMERFDDDVPF